MLQSGYSPMNCNSPFTRNSGFQNVSCPGPRSRRFKFLPRNQLRPGAALVAMSLLAACTTSNIDQGLQPTASVSSQATQVSPPEQIEAATQQQASNQVALLPIDREPVQKVKPSPGVTFLPVVGPPQFAVTRLASAVKSEAGENAVTIIPNGQSGASYQIKGYFSALDDGSGTILVFIWDILDASNKTLHRISGEERTTSRKSDPWSAVDAGMIDNIVARTMKNLRGWMDTRA